MKTPINIDSELLNKLREISLEDNISLENLVELSIIVFLENRGHYDVK